MEAANHWILIRGIVSEEFHWWDFRHQLAHQFPDDVVSTVDIPGNGKTYRSRTPISVKANVESLRRQAPGPGRKILVGFSLGGMLAAEWAHRYPEEVGGVVLINASFNDAPVVKRMRPSAFFRIAKLAFHRDLVRREESVLSLTTNLLPPEKRKEIAQAWAPRGQEYPVSVANFLAQMVMAGRIRQRELTVPALILSSGRDSVVHPDCSAHIARKWNAEFHRNPQAGHDLTLDAPDWVLERLGAFRSAIL